ncbi:MAG: D-alanine--D-alanine ligase, partial [Armatimonadota bacterium]
MTQITPEQAGKVAVLAGGDSLEREVSLRSGRGIAEALARQGFEVVSIDPQGDVAQRLRESGAQVVFNILHGGKGEDGTIQGLLDILGLPYTGSGVLASALAMDKAQSKRIFKATDIPTPSFCVIDPDEPVGKQCRFAANQLKLPAVCKPTNEGSSFGVSIVRHQEEMIGAVEALVAKYGNAMIERFVDGPEITVGVLGVGDRLRALPVLELVAKADFYNYEAKYTPGMTEFVIPARLDELTTRLTQEAALRAHQVLGCHGWSRVDGHIDEDGMPQIREVNTIPGMTELSDVPAEAEADG